VKAGGTPAASTTKSAPRPSVSSRTRSRRSAAVVVSIEIVSVAPSRSATASRSSGAPITMTRPTRLRVASTVVARPPGPLPWTTTVCPIAISPSRVIPATAVGSAHPSATTASAGTSSGTRWNSWVAESAA
jgi:hypothetical protein